MAVRVAQHEMGGVEDEDDGAHVLVDVAAKRDHSGDVEDLRGHGPLVRAVAAEVEALRRRIGEDIVVGVVEIRKLHAGADLDREEHRHEVQVLLGHGRGRGGRRPRKRALEVDDGDRRVRRKDPPVGDDPVALVHDGRVERLRQLHRAFGGGLGRGAHPGHRRKAGKGREGAEVSKGHSGGRIV